jgi:glycerophosphoryl diester phosphodiesterase
MKDVLGRIKLFLENVWMLLAVDPLNKVIFSFSCALLSLFVAEVTKNAFFRVLIELVGIRYVDKSNMIAVCTSPVTVMLILLFLIIMTFTALFEIGGLLHSFSMAQIGRKTDIWSMVAAGARTCRKTLAPRNWPVLLFVMVLFPITGILSLSNAAYKVRIPLFVELGIEARPLFARTFSIMYLIMILVEIGVLFSINIYVLRETSFFRSCKGAWKLGKKRLLNTVICMLILSLIVNSTIKLLTELMPGGGTPADAVAHIIKALIVPSVNNAGITALFYQYFEEDRSLAGINPYIFRTEEFSSVKKTAVAGCIVLILAGSIFYTAHNFAYLSEDVARPAVCAHRGDNVNAPDNSYEAFELAVSEGLPWIELDVQITADGVVVAEHDQSLKRRFGFSGSVADMTYEELRKHDIINGKGEKYKHVRITTLEEVLLLAKENNMLVQIETKPSEKRPGLEEEVLRLIEKTGMHDRVMIISLFSDSIAKVKELDPEITAAHAVMMTWKDYAEVEDADNLSAEVGTVRPELVHALHEAGMKVFCWTADDPDGIQYLVSCGVDVIGTDDPVMVTEMLEEADYSGGFRRFYHLMMTRIADMER